MQTEFFRLDILSPVHIGTGDELDPMSYLMQDGAGSPFCHIIDTHAWAAEYPDPDELCTRFSGSNVPQMRKFLADNLDPEIYGTRRITITDESIFKEYLKKRDDQRTSNQLRLSPQMSSNGRAPILPGSSLKGALRTAIIDWLDREQQLGLKKNPAEYNRKLEQALGKITDNAFKQLKIGDVEGWSDSTVLVEALEIRRKEGQTATPKSKCEALPSRMLGLAECTALYGKFLLGDWLNNNQKLTLPGGKSWSWQELCALTNAYLLVRLDSEISKFYQQPQFAKARPLVETLRHELATASPGTMYLRVGHYSQVEFVTVSDNQPLTRKGKQGSPLPHGTTRTLANGHFPFGWVRLTPCGEEEYRQGTFLRETANHYVAETRFERRKEIGREKAARIAEQQEKVRQAQQAAEAEALRQAELEAMSPVDRQLHQLQQGDLLEHQVIELYNGLDAMDESDRLKTARAIQGLWEKIGKWNKKECSKKQWEKVVKLKGYLGET
ncbi:RAMP superfamily CRISPR-associated protein [Sulfuriflexus sp.]|uniref:RAMP superfamily CRISPR-associated protein n=1 Tax=Sulfuriflexus sp. TaxID=2015443 RepID=UPI0028CD4E91|nr:RAMP superfamily CRISPR-associated protein [Sulfuriflexus sp.]MDT8405450.1 RAMP superfamily CRISPR-associated protein [Sulfuriflexus sp.]